MARKKASNNKVVVGNIREVSGKVTIAGGDIYAGYTVEQVSFLLKEITTSYRRKPFDGRCPYKGLEVFEEEDADLFFGRERLVDDLVSRMKESRTVFITGPSGSGKSSLVRAGLIHALKGDALRGSDRWLYETMKPGREPIKELSLAFSRLKGPDLTDYFLAHASEPDVLHRCAESVLSGQKTQRFVLFIDQFEEVFTQISGEEERQAFIHMLAHAGTVENGRVIVLFAMRSDFVSNCATYPALNELLSQEFRQIGAMQPDELVAAIALPAKEVGLPVEEELVAQIINDMKGEPGALPLMQFALKDLFDAQQAKGGVIALTLEDYLKHGGIQKSLERHADASLAALDEKSQVLARSIFSGLIEIGRGTADTKRTALFDELIPANSSTQEVLAIVQKLADARLIITDEQAGKDTVTISHEKLIEAWPWLKKLVNENRDVIALQNEIAGDAKEWEDHQRDPSYLYSGARLVNANEQSKSNKLVLSGTAFEYIRAGQARQQRNRTSLIAAISGIIGLLFLGVIVFSSQSRNNANIASTAQAASTFAISQQGTAQAITTIAVAQESLAYANAKQAQEQATIARAGELAAQAVSQRELEFDLSLLLSVEAFRTQDTLQTRTTLLDNTQTDKQLIKYMHGQKDSGSSIAFSPDGKTVAYGIDDGTILLWDRESDQPTTRHLKGHNYAVSSVVFSPDGKTLASGSCAEKPAWGCVQGHIILWDVATGQQIGQSISKYSDEIWSVAFSPDGKTLAEGSNNGNITLWDVSTLRHTRLESDQYYGELLTIDLYSSVNCVTFSPDGKTLASGHIDSSITLWNIEDLQPIGHLSRGQLYGSINSIAFRPDGKWLASGSDNGSISLWAVDTSQPIGPALTGHDEPVNSVAFSPDGKTLASGSDDFNVVLWDIRGFPFGRIRPSFAGQGDRVITVAFSPDGKTIVSGSLDNTVVLWDVANRQPLAQILRGLDEPTSIAFSPDGKTLALGDWIPDSVSLWDMEKDQPIGKPLDEHSIYVNSVAFSPDGKTLASGSNEGTITLWDVASHQPIGQPLSTDSDEIFRIVFSPDGKTLASTSIPLGGDYTITLWDVASHQPLGQPLKGHSGYIATVAFRPDGKALASGSDDGTIILWDVASHQPLGQSLTGHNVRVNSVAFSSDGNTLASGSDDSTIILWDVASQQPLGQPLTGHNGSVNSVAFSPDGYTLVSTGDDNTVILWDIVSQQPVGQPLIGPNFAVRDVVFSRDGKTIASLGSGIILWDLDPESWIAQSCQRAGRNLTHAEWARYFPNEEYRKTCEQWPLEPYATLMSTPSPTP